MKVLSLKDRLLLVRLGFAFVIGTVLTTAFAAIALGLIIGTGQLFLSFSGNLILAALWLIFFFVGWVMAEHIK